MAKKKLRALYTGVLLCLAAAGLAGCGSGDDENPESAVTGRVTSISETQIVMEAFEKPEGERPDAASGSGAGFGKNHGDSQNREKPRGTPPADGDKASSITVQDAQNFGGRRPENQGPPES